MREISMTPFRLMSPLLAAALLLAMAACSKSPSTESATTEAEGAEAPAESEAGIAPVKLDAAAMKAAGIGVAMFGCLVVVTNGDPRLLFTGQVGLGEWLIIGCSVLWAVYTFVGRRGTRSLSPLAMTFGASVTGWQAGDRVLVNPLNKKKGLMGEMMDGGMAEYCLVSAEQLIRMPDGVSFEEAAALPVAYGTAHIEEVKGMFSDPDAFVTAAPFLFLLASVIVFTFGPGKFSIDELLRRRKAASL